MTSLRHDRWVGKVKLQACNEKLVRYARRDSDYRYRSLLWIVPNGAYISHEINVSHISHTNSRITSSICNFNFIWRELYWNHVSPVRFSITYILCNWRRWKEERTVTYINWKRRERLGIYIVPQPFLTPFHVSRHYYPHAWNVVEISSAVPIALLALGNIPLAHKSPIPFRTFLIVSVSVTPIVHASG